MNEILNQNIKDLINQYPSMAKLLTDFNIACTTCNVGTCRLKDIVEIHNLSEENEKRLFTRVAEIVYPGITVEIPHLARKTVASGAKNNFSPPMQMLVDEHKHIKRVIAAIPDIVESLKSNAPDKCEIVMQAVDFIKNYADCFHHAKVYHSTRSFKVVFSFSAIQARLVCCRLESSSTPFLPGR